jgi:membrane-associated protease RseP (regulator of RpoE activity)
MADHHAIEHDVWNRLGGSGDVFSPVPGGLGILPGNGDTSLPGSFHVPIFGSTLKVGALVEPLTSQMAEYMGVPHGLMVKQVVRKSEAAAAGLKAFDVILKLGSESIMTSADWERALHANEGKPVQVTILRDRKQQTLILQVDSKRRSGLAPDDLLPGSDVQMARLAQGLEATSDSKPDTNADPGLDAGAVSMKELLHQLPLGDEAGDLEEQLRNRFESEGAGQPAKAGAAPSAAVIAPTLQSVPLPQAPPLAPLQSANLPLAARRAPQSQQRLLTPGFDSTVQVFQQSEQLNQQHFDQMKQKMDGMKTKLEEMKTQNFKSSN